MWGQPPPAVRASEARLCRQLIRTQDFSHRMLKPSGALLPRTADGGCPHIMLRFLHCIPNLESLSTFFLHKNELHSTLPYHT
jgi:hypothetical protein